MRPISSVNDFVIRFANVNGTGSASANGMFAKAIYRMGIPVSAKNIFPSNIQGLPTWYEVRVSEQGHLGRRGGYDIMVSVNPQSMAKDLKGLEPGGYFLYDNTKPLDPNLHRDDVNFIGVPLTDICRREYSDPRQRQLFKNVIYVGALAALLDMEFEVFNTLVADQFKGKEKLVAPNIHALELGYQYVKEHLESPLPITTRRSDGIGNRILLEGNEAVGLGAIYGGATVAAWYPITPSTSVVEAYEKYGNRLRIDPGSGNKKFAVVQAEDELSAIGIAIGAGWNGARAFTATSGPGVSLMSEFLGLAYFAEIPVVLVDVQRAGPSTGMPTRTQQSDILFAAYASHGDTKQVLLIPGTPKEAFDMAAASFDLADRLQTPIILMSDLDLGMNEHLSDPLEWDDERRYDRGKVFNESELENMDARFGRYLDVDGDAIPYRTYPGTHAIKGAFFTRGTSRDEYAQYTEEGEAYVRNMDRLLRKWDTAKTLVPEPVLYQDSPQSSIGMVFYGSSVHACDEALDILREEDGVHIDAMRIRAFPFNRQVQQFLADHEQVFVVEMNRDGQMRTLLMNECEHDPARLPSVRRYDGLSITASDIVAGVRKVLDRNNVVPLKKKA